MINGRALFVDELAEARDTRETCGLDIFELSTGETNGGVEEHGNSGTAKTSSEPACTDPTGVSVLAEYITELYPADALLVEPTARCA